MAEEKKTSLMRRIESCIERYAHLVNMFKNSSNNEIVLKEAEGIYDALAILSFSLFDYSNYTKLEKAILTHNTDKKRKRYSPRFSSILSTALHRNEIFDEEKGEQHFQEELVHRLYYIKNEERKEIDFEKRSKKFRNDLEERLKKHLPENLRIDYRELADRFITSMQRAMVSRLISSKSGYLNKFSLVEKTILMSLSAGIMYGTSELISSSLGLPTLIQVWLNEEEERQEYKNYHFMLHEVSEPDKERGFRLAPNKNVFYSSPKGFVIDLQTDENGLYTGEAEKKGPIVTVGDSFTFGFGVRKEDAWPNILEKQLGVEVTNFGVYGYNLPQYNKLMEMFNQFSGRIILYGIYTNDMFVDEKDDDLENYYENNGWVLYQSPNPTLLQLTNAKTSRKSSLINGTFTYKILEEICNGTEVNSTLNDICAIFITPPYIIQKKSGMELSYRGPEEKVPSEEELEGSISRLHREYDKAIKIAKDISSHLVVVLFSSKNLAYRKLYTDAFGTDKSLKMEVLMRKNTKDYFKKRDILLIDVRTPLERKQREGSEVFLKRDRHLNEYGNEIVAQEIACKLTKGGYVQPTRSITEICKEKQTLTSTVTPGIIYLDELDF